MRATAADKSASGKILIDTAELQNVLCTGRAAAIDIGTAAGARVQQGRLVRWNIRKIEKYIDSISE